MEFRAGQLIEIINNKGMSASIGATAKIYKTGRDFIYVEWQDSKSNTQCPGAYYRWHFRPVRPINNQLLFEFMYE